MFDCIGIVRQEIGNWELVDVLPLSHVPNPHCLGTLNFPFLISFKTDANGLNQFVRTPTDKSTRYGYESRFVVGTENASHHLKKLLFPAPIDPAAGNLGR